MSHLGKEEFKLFYVTEEEEEEQAREEGGSGLYPNILSIMSSACQCGTFCGYFFLDSNAAEEHFSET